MTADRAHLQLQLEPCGENYADGEKPALIPR